MPVFTSIYYMWGEDFFFNFCKDLFLDFRCPWQMNSFQPAVRLPLLNLSKQCNTTLLMIIIIPLVSGPSTALAEYFHLFPAVMNLRLLHTGYKSVINRNSDSTIFYNKRNFAKFFT